MNRRYHLIWVLVAACILLSGCHASAGETISSETEQTAMNFFEGSIGKDGMVYREDGLLHFVDFSSKEDVVLCNKPNCKHSAYDSVSNPDPYCDATIPSEGVYYYSFIHDYTLYAMAVMKNTVIYERDAGGSGWKKSMELPYPIRFTDKIIVEDNRLYMVADELKTDEDTLLIDTLPLVLEVNLKKKTYKELTEPLQDKGSVGMLTVSDGYLYYLHNYLDDSYSNLNFEEQLKLTAKDFTDEVYRIHLKDGTTECVFDNKEDRSYRYIGVYGDKLYLIKENKLIEYNINNHQKKILWETEHISSGKIFDNIIIIDCSDSSNTEKGAVFYAWYLGQNKEKVVNRPSGEALNSINANGILTVCYFEADNRITGAITLEDYLNGKSEYIVQYQQKAYSE